MTRLCESDEFSVPSDLACSDAIAVALNSVADQPGAVARVEIRWQVICEAGPCATPAPETAQAIIRYVDGRAVGVVIRRLDAGGISAERPVTLRSVDLETPPPFAAPSKGLAPVTSPPAEVAARTPAPLCGIESAGLAGPFDARARTCFLAAVLNSSPSEFLSIRADIEGRPFTELWRFGGRGPVVVYSAGPGGWSKLTCSLLLLNDGRQQFNHTDCNENPMN